MSSFKHLSQIEQANRWEFVVIDYKKKSTEDVRDAITYFKSHAVAAVTRLSFMVPLLRAPDANVRLETVSLFNLIAQQNPTVVLPYVTDLLDTLKSENSHWLKRSVINTMIPLVKVHGSGVLKRHGDEIAAALWSSDTKDEAMALIQFAARRDPDFVRHLTREAKCTLQRFEVLAPAPYKKSGLSPQA